MLWAEKYPEIFPEHKGYFSISESFASFIYFCSINK